MRPLTSFCAAILLLSAGIARSQPPYPPNDVLPPEGQSLPSATIIRLDPSLDHIVSPQEKVYVVRGSNEFGITDGNAWVPDGQNGYLLFSDIVANVIYKYVPTRQELSVFLQNSGYTGTLASASTSGSYFGRVGPLYIFNFGSNGIAIDPQGRVVFCAQGDREVVRLEKDGTRTVLASSYQGKPLNHPNKLAILADGTIYFSDLRLGNCPICQQDTQQALYMIKNGEVTRIEDRGHGVTLSPDQKVLYTSTVHPAGQGAAGGIILRYDVGSDDSLANERVLVDMAGQTAPNGVAGGPDGFTIDSEGNLYSGGPGGVWIIDPNGKHIGTILLPRNSTNLGFGDPDMKTLYLLDQRVLLKVRLKVAGVPPRRANATSQ